MALTLAQFAMMENRPLNKGVIRGLLEYSFLMDRIPWSSTDELSTMVTRWKTLPNSADFRDLNEGFGEGTGDLEQIQEGLYDFGTDIDVDRVYTKVKNTVVDPRAQQTKMQLKSIAYQFNDLFVNSDRATSPKGIDGIKVRATALSNDDSELLIDAAGMDLSEGTGRADYDVQLFLDYMHRILYRMENEGGEKVILCNGRTKLALLSMFRRSNLLGQMKAHYDDKDLDTFMGCPLLDLGVKADQSTPIIAYNHDDTTQTGTSSRTSLYIVALGEGDAVHGVQLAPMDTRDLGELQEKPVLRTRMEWTWGLANWSRRGIGRVKGLYVANA